MWMCIAVIKPSTDLCAACRVNGWDPALWAVMTSTYHDDFSELKAGFCCTLLICSECGSEGVKRPAGVGSVILISGLHTSKNRQLVSASDSLALFSQCNKVLMRNRVRRKEKLGNIDALSVTVYYRILRGQYLLLIMWWISFTLAFSNSWIRSCSLIFYNNTTLTEFLAVT